MAGTSIPQLGFVVDTIASRAANHDRKLTASEAEDLRQKLRKLTGDLLDDERAFVTSANFTAQERNIEAGLLVEDTGLARSLGIRFETLVESGELLPLDFS